METRGARVKLIRVSDVLPERVSWLWPGYIPLGKITLLDGDPGLGKSNTTLDLAARVTRGQAMPDGSQCDIDGPADVIILSAEDGVADTIRPRLEEAGADLTRVHVLESVSDEDGLERLPEIPGDLENIERIVEARQAALLIVDPLMAYLSPDTNSYRDQDVRRALAPVKLLAERTSAAVVVVRHLNKSATGSPIYRGGGSIGIIGAARAGLLVGLDPDDESGVRRVLATTKHNLGPDVPSLAFHIEAAGFTCRVVWEGVSNHAAASLLTAAPERDARHEAEDFLRAALAEGPRPAKDVQREGRECGISEPTLRRAKTALRVVVTRVGEAGRRGGGEWRWSLPDGLDDHVSLYGQEDHVNRSESTAGAERGRGDHLNPLPGTAVSGDYAARLAGQEEADPTTCIDCGDPVAPGRVRCADCALPSANRPHEKAKL